MGRSISAYTDEEKRTGKAPISDVYDAAVEAYAAYKEEARRHRSHPEPVPQDTGSHRTPPVHPPDNPPDLVKTWMNAHTDPDRGGEHNGYNTQLNAEDERAYKHWLREHHLDAPYESGLVPQVTMEGSLDTRGMWKHLVKNDLAFGMTEEELHKAREIFEKPHSDRFTQTSLLTLEKK